MNIVKKSALVFGLSYVFAIQALANQAFAQEIQVQNPVVATVNDKQITLFDVEDARSLLPAQFQAAPLKQVYPMLVETLINSRIAADMAHRLGFDESSQYTRRMDRISDQVLERILLTRHLQQKITDVLVQERFLQLVERKKGQKEVHARHILLKSEEMAQTLIEKLDDGADFGDLAREFSKGPSGRDGGDLGWFGPGRMVPQFDRALKDLSVGAYSSKPVMTQFGWHVILVEDRRPLPIPNLKSARSGLVNSLSAELGQKLMKQLREDATIKLVPFADVQNIKKTGQ